MTVLVHVRGDREAASAASPRSETLPEAYARLSKLCGGCPIEAGLIGAIADNECEHERLPSDTSPPCGCWPSEVVKDPPLVIEEMPAADVEMAEAKVATPVPAKAVVEVAELELELEVEEIKPEIPVATESASQLVEIPPFIEALVEQIDAELDRLRAQRERVVTLKEAIG
jgi:hypothetical protein